MSRYLWPPYETGRPLYFCPVVTIFLSIFFSSPNLSCRRLDVYHTSTHGSLEIQDAKNPHFGTIAQLCRAISLELRHVSTIGKKLFKQQYLLHMSWYGELQPTITAEICWRVWGTPAYFYGLRVLAALLHGTLVVGVSQTLRRWTGRHLYSAGRHHVGHWLTF